MPRGGRHREGSAVRKRAYKREKPYILVFCEGESEEAYINAIRKKFVDVAVLKARKMKNFEDAHAILRKDRDCQNNLEVTNEIWFFFDVEKEKAGTWQDTQDILRKVMHLQKGRTIRVRLLMTMGCVEYWFLLHYKRCAPQICTPESKIQVKDTLQTYEPAYRKGDPTVTASIATHLDTALDNGDWSLQRLLQNGLPKLDDCPERNYWLFQGNVTFTTVHEAMKYLSNLGNQI